MKKVALITGSGKKRVGNYIAHFLAEKEYNIAIHYRTAEEEAIATVKELSKKIKAKAFQADIADPNEVNKLIEDVVKEFGKIDVLVNAAAAFKKTPLKDLSNLNKAKEYLDFFHNVNLAGTYLVSLAVGKQMLKQKSGVIITIADWAVTRPYKDYLAYHPSKGAVQVLSRALAKEFAPFVRVNCILPGPIMLPKDMPKKEKKEAINATLVKRLGSPKNIAQAVLHFIENDFITGVSLPVDGGRTIA